MKAYVIALYILAIYIIGYIASRTTKNVLDYVIGNRTLNTYTTALGAGASDMSGWLMMALPGVVFINGITEIWLPIGLIFGAYLNWKFIAKRLRQYTHKFGNSLTIPSYFANRFNDQSNLLRLVTSFTIIIFFIIYIASAFVSSAFIFEIVLDLRYQEALLLSALIIVSYTSLGGFIAINWIDVMQGTLMLIVLLVVPFAIVQHLGGIRSSFDILNSIKFNVSDPFLNNDRVKIVSLLIWGIGYFGQPHILARFMGAKNHHIIEKSRIICMTWMILSMAGAFLVGVFGAALYPQGIINSETIFLKASDALFSDWFSGILFAAVLSAIMSTISAQLLVSSSSLVEDVISRFYTKNSLLARNGLLVNKIAVVLIAVVAVFLAYNPKNTVLSLVAYGWAGLGATMGPVILLSLYWKKMTKFGAMLGIILSTPTVIIWHNLQGGIFDLYEIGPGFLACCLGIVLGSFIENSMQKLSRKYIVR